MITHTPQLNAWHKSRHNNQVPSGWVASPDPSVMPDVFWPFNVLNPDGARNLQEGDYVIISGAFVQDSAHLHEDIGTEPYWRDNCWEDKFKGQGGWLEIHPLDSIRFVPESQEPTIQKHPQLIQLCDNGDGHTPTDMNSYLTPISTPKANSILKFREIIDDRFTDMSTVLSHTVTIDTCQPTKLHVEIHLKANVKAHFKAVFLLWWEEGNSPRPTTCPPHRPTPSDKPTPEDLPVCSKKPYLPQCNNPTIDQNDRTDNH